MRRDIGTEPVAAGVVDKKKRFTYDLWGGAVNVANRITGEGVPAMVQVDNATFCRLRQRFDFHEPKTSKSSRDDKKHRCARRLLCCKI